MARLHPSIEIARRTAAHHREVDVLERLVDSLHDGFAIFHSVDWHSVHDGRDQHGELDVVVVDPEGRVALLEVKAGQVEFRDRRIFKAYRSGEKDVGRQVRVQFSALLARLQAAGFHTYLSHFLVLPDLTIADSQIVAIPPERIIDARGFDEMGSRIRNGLAAGHGTHDVEALCRFFANQFEVAPDLSIVGNQVRAMSIRLSDGLATWVPRIKAPSGVIRVSATAGSGKTQLALRLLNDATDSGSRALYVCFNRSLADHMGHLATTRARVASFHELCVDHFRARHGEPDFSAPGIFERMAEAYCLEHVSDEYDLIVIDEGQDFDPRWVGAMLDQCNPEGRLYLFEDESQRLYDRDTFDISEAVEIACDDNFRSPKQVCAVINALGLASQPIRSRGPYEGDVPGFHVYAGERDLLRKTATAVESLVERGISLADVVVLSMRGLAASVLMKADRIGPYCTRRFAGTYSSDGEPVWTEGELLVDTVHRFKGQSANGVVLSELEFESLGERERRRLFVGMTRARLAVELVIGEKADSALRDLIG
ncbi:MAG: ATP-binding domain-containing protein [Rhodocyclaceae bacterium]|nr:ATP-binding domain-containing protein [Rhodocyclaceae bacterium]